MATFSAANSTNNLMGVKVTLKSYIWEDPDDDTVEEKEVLLVRGAVIANNSSGSMISSRLAKELGLKQSNEPISLINPFFGGQEFQTNTGNRPVLVEHELLPLGFGFIYPVIVDDLYWDLILGGESMIPYLLSALFNPVMKMKPTEGPGFDEGTIFMGHNIGYADSRDEDRMNQYTSIFVLKFDGASRGNPGLSGAASFLYEYTSRSYEDGYNPNCVWFDSEFLGPKTSNESEYLALIFGLEQCVDSLTRNVGLPYEGLLGKSSIPLRNTSICICGDSELVIKQLKGEYAVENVKLKPLHGRAKRLIAKLKAAGNRVSLCWIPREENTSADRIANVVIDRALGVDNGVLEDEEEDDEEEELTSEEMLARSHLVYTSDPTLLSLKEIQKSWGSCMNFMLSYGLKPWKNEDIEEAKAISRAMKEGDDEDEET